jgi:hypothetical protein
MSRANIVYVNLCRANIGSCGHVQREHCLVRYILWCDVVLTDGHGRVPAQAGDASVPCGQDTWRAQGRPQRCKWCSCSPLCIKVQFCHVTVAWSHSLELDFLQEDFLMHTRITAVARAPSFWCGRKLSFYYFEQENICFWFWGQTWGCYSEAENKSVLLHC